MITGGARFPVAAPRASFPPPKRERTLKKLSLNVENLQVESFDTSKLTEARGTVAAHAPSYPDPVRTCAYHCTWIGVTCE